MSSPQKRLRHPYHLKKMYAGWRFRILKSAHTGRRVHHQHTSYPMIAMLLLCAGLIMAPASGIALADTLTVSATVYGAPPAHSATIDDPINGRVFGATPITVSGTCEDQTYVQLFRNSYPSGTALCSASGSYLIQTDLFEGANELVAHIYNFANQEGPVSSPVTVTYTPPVVTSPIQGSNGSTSSGNNAAGESSSAPVFALRNDFSFRGYAIGEQASWQVALVGGTAPYSVTVDWGDGQKAEYVSKTADMLTLTHTYSSVGSNDGSYAIIVSAHDAEGQHAALQIMALVTNPNASATGSGSTGSGSGASGTNGTGTTGSTIFGIDTKRIVAYSWSTFGGVAVATTGFWLGEVRQLRLIRLRFRLTKL